MKRKWEISRRTVLRGLGAAMALPMLDAMVPSVARAQAVGGTPRRLLFFFVPNGIYMPSWTPSGEGTGYAFTPTLQPLEPFRDDILVVSGLDNRPGEDVIAGNHARGTAAFLTCVPPVKTSDGSLRVGISADQVAAQAIGKQTRFASLELGAEPSVEASSCDSGYSCAYISNISWAGPETPMAKEVDPRLVFDRLFAGGQPGENAEQIARRNRYKKSILDFVSEDAKTLQSRLGTNDRQKLDEYLTGVRTLEQRISASGEQTCSAGAAPGGAANRQETAQQMCDLIALAFQCDLTRVCTFMLANGFTNTAYSFLGVGEGHHELSHHREQDSYIDHLKRIDRWEVEQFAYLVGKLKAIQEGEGSVLDNSLVLFSSELSDGNNHHHINKPVVLAGRGGGEVRPGRHIYYRGAGGEFPVADLYMTMLANVGVHVESFGRGHDGNPYGTRVLTELG
ncbi:DUF1552 domain-containing protein [Vulgatibacter sp.]|uniref:DUF1552 domain-containing protein n=1 Tax=Vulgatibacter sp. TaxID=1971226 RepID=UPI003561CBB6